MNAVNGVRSWIETHHEVVSVLAVYLHENGHRTTGIIDERMNEGGRCEMFDLAIEITDKFEKINEGREWDGEFLDEVYEYTKSELQIN